MIYKNVKTILFASLIAAMILPFSMMDNVSAQSKATYDPTVVDYIEKLISTPGKNIDQKIIDGKTISVMTKTKQLSNTVYKVKTTTVIDGTTEASEKFRIILNDDGTYTLKNKKLGIDETFTDRGERVKRGSGNSDYEGAAISLYDKEYGTPNTLKLYDSYSACATFNQAVFDATVKPSVIDVNWEASSFYLHWCFVPYEWEDGYIQYGTTKHYLSSDPNHDDRRGFHAFNNGSGGTTWYSMTAKFFYGAW
jgi:hypothetical protein